MRFVAEAIDVRKTNGLEIVFYDHQSVAINNGTTTVWFHHWFHSPRGYHANCYGRFTRALKNHRKISLAYIYELAQRYDVSWQYGRRPDLTNKPIKELSPEGRKTNKEAK